MKIFALIMVVLVVVMVIAGRVTDPDDEIFDESWKSGD